MATTEDSQHHEIKDSATEEETISTNGESTPLIGNEGQGTCARMQSKFRC